MAEAADRAPDSGAPDSTAPAVVIRVIRTGGIAGVRRGWRVETRDVEAWEPIVSACPWDRVEDAAAEPDRFVWLIEVRAPEPSRRAVLPEREVYGPWRELVDRVRSEGEPLRAPRPGRTDRTDQHG
ncbi:protealysin inhibitor emfourin [Salinibacterium sp. ZJ70]|uniref:protealysin inhibitor emfourin n=1 Tax=Salinibacterium sp. ZJ70 TaxID=2708084 RepID=UPI00174C77CD|nr:protealysin inhibitor emfourin [Salinibacterium sp. ZJ70]